MNQMNPQNRFVSVTDRNRESAIMVERGASIDDTTEESMVIKFLRLIQRIEIPI
jgi:hypothetical protein